MLGACSGLTQVGDAGHPEWVGLPPALAAATIAATFAETWPDALPLDRLGGCAPVVRRGDDAFEVIYAVAADGGLRALGTHQLSRPALAGGRVVGGALRGATGAGLRAPGGHAIRARVEPAPGGAALVTIRADARPDVQHAAATALDALRIVAAVADPLRRAGPADPRAPGASAVEDLAFLRPLRAALAQRHAARLELDGDVAGAARAVSDALSAGATPSPALLTVRARLADALGRADQQRDTAVARALGADRTAVPHTVAARRSAPADAAPAGPDLEVLLAARGGAGTAPRALLTLRLAHLDPTDGSAALDTAWLAIDHGDPRCALRLLLRAWPAAEFERPAEARALLAALTERLGSAQVARIAATERRADGPADGPWLAGIPRAAVRPAAAPPR